MQPHVLVGLFALLTAIVAGAVIGRIIGVSAGEGMYLTALVLSAVGWFIGRCANRREERL
jgi:ABC-type multidrug transport system permease subunit